MYTYVIQYGFNVLPFASLCTHVAVLLVATVAASLLHVVRVPVTVIAVILHKLADLVGGQLFPPFTVTQKAK